VRTRIPSRPDFGALVGWLLLCCEDCIEILQQITHLGIELGFQHSSWESRGFEACDALAEEVVSRDLGVQPDQDDLAVVDDLLNLMLYPLLL